MVLLGQWSYALYLVHATVIYALIYWFGARPSGFANVGWLVAVTALCVAISAALYEFIEHPVERRLRAMQPRPSAEPVPPGAPEAVAG